uniref:Fork-head domain-containing protein n=1 Tax=Ciona savignyi TaxID=51511 RepID=H2ZI64_CIOSA
RMSDPVDSKPNAFLHPTSNPPLPNTSFGSFSAQQLAALGPYLQASANPTLQAIQTAQQMQNISPAGLSSAYLQKWLLAAQQTTINQQPAKKRKKQDCYQRSRMSFNPFVHNQKEVYLPSSNTLTPPTPTNGHANQPPTPGNTPGSGKRYKRYAKPPYSYVSLITLSILSSPEKKLRLSQILKRISEMFPFFNGSYQGWRDSVRHNLSQNECFVKVLKNPYRPTAKGNYWTVNITAIPHELLLRQNTLVSRYAQDSGFRYRKDLSEVFDLISGRVKTSIPRHLFNSGKLISDPAVVMEALLLEEKSDDESPTTNNYDVTTYSLEDMFNQDDFLEEDMLRQHQNNNSNRWSNKARQRANQAKLAVPCLPNPTSQQQYMNNMEPHKLAAQMIGSNPIFAQKELLSKALSNHKLNCFPFLQSYYAHAQSDKLQEVVPERPRSPALNFADNWGHGEEKRNKRKGAQPTRKFSSSDVKTEDSLSPLAPSAVDSGISGSPRSSTRSFCSSEPDVTTSSIDHASPVRSRSDVSSETITSSPRDVADDVVSPKAFAPGFGIYSGLVMEGKLA